MNASVEKGDFQHVKSDLHELLVMVVNIRLQGLMLWKHLQCSRTSCEMQLENLPMHWQYEALVLLTMLIIHVRQ